MINSRQSHESHSQQFSSCQRPDALYHQAQGNEVDQRIGPLLEHIMAVFLTLDQDWRVTYLNHQSDPLLADLRNNLLGKTFWEVFPETIDAPFFRAYRQTLEATHEVHREEYYLPLHKWFEVHIVARLEGWEVSLRDISQRKHAEKALVATAAIVESSGDAIYSRTLDGIVLSWNSGAERLYGYRASEIIGKHISILVPTDRYQELQAFMDSLQLGEGVAHFETVGLKKDGQAVEVSVSFTCIKDVTGQIIVVAVACDITERKQLQEQIWQSKQQLQAIIDGSPACIYVRDVHHRYIHVNQKCANLVHLTKEQLLGKTDDEFFPREIAEMWQIHDREILATGQAGEWEEVSLQEDGLHTFLSVKFPLFNTSGVPYAVCGISTDITERRLGQRRDEFISMASHELKTPLTSLLAYTDLLRLLLEREGSQQAIQYVSKMESQFEKLTRLIADLLDISKVQAGKLMFAEELVVVDDLVHEVVENVQLTTPRHRIVIEGTTACELIGDKDRLGQVVINLLSNAIKYSPQAETVLVNMAHTPEEITVSVQDFGIGIPPHSLEKVFERFYRLSSNMEKGFPGLGIGLYIAHQIVSHYGGRIWVESVEGQGSTFSFSLPLKRR
jgi:PAS domain S-box-containing protein